jgi:preprotein translocase subunit SecF
LNIIGKRFYFFAISGLVILVGIISLFTFDLRYGIEFSSGSVVRVGFEQAVELDKLRQELAGLGYGNALIQHTEADDYIIRTHELTGTEKTALEEALSAEFGQLAETEFNTVSPMVARETAQNTAIAVAIAAIGILLYITWAFHRMPKPFHYGTCALIALIHDTLVALGIFSIIGGVLGWEVDLKFIIGILAVIGYSVNNTVVVFDRIRENQTLGVSSDFEVVVNNSLLETLSRSLNTTLTTLFVVLALMLFVGVSIQNFTAVLLIGVIAGTFSSIGIAPSLLVVWERREWGRFRQWLPLRGKS